MNDAESLECVTALATHLGLTAVSTAHLPGAAAALRARSVATIATPRRAAHAELVAMVRARLEPAAFTPAGTWPSDGR